MNDDYYPEGGPAWLGCMVVFALVALAALIFYLWVTHFETMTAIMAGVLVTGIIAGALSKK